MALSGVAILCQALILLLPSAEAAWSDADKAALRSTCLNTNSALRAADADAHCITPYCECASEAVPIQFASAADVNVTSPEFTAVANGCLQKTCATYDSCLKYKNPATEWFAWSNTSKAKFCSCWSNATIAWLVRNPQTVMPFQMEVEIDELCLQEPSADECAILPTSTFDPVDWSSSEKYSACSCVAASAAKYYATDLTATSISADREASIIHACADAQGRSKGASSATGVTTAPASTVIPDKKNEFQKTSAESPKKSASSSFVQPSRSAWLLGLFLGLHMTIVALRRG